MGNTIFLFLIFFVIFLVIEFIMMGAFRSIHTTRASRILGTLCRVTLTICIVGYLLLIGLFLFAGIDLIQQGEIVKGISILFWAAVIAICVYVWLIRGWIKYLRQSKQKL